MCAAPLTQTEVTVAQDITVTEEGIGYEDREGGREGRRLERERGWGLEKESGGRRERDKRS